jgi:hypothetical protein
MPRQPDGTYRYPDGTPGNTGQTIFSARYNTFLDDLALAMNTPLPVNMGGTGGTTIGDALANLNAEIAAPAQTVVNYDSQVWKSGSFKSAAGTAAAPSVNAITGIVYVTDANNFVVEARDMVTGVKYTRLKSGGVWLGTAPYWVNDSGSDKLPLAGGTMTGVLDTKATTGVIGSAPASLAFLNVTGAGGSNNAFMQFLMPGVFGSYFGMQGDGNYYMGGFSHGPISYKFWTSRDFDYTPANVAGQAFTGAISATNVIANQGTIYTYGLGGDPNQGAIRFSSDGNKYLHYNGVGYNFIGGQYIQVSGGNASLSLNSGANPGWVFQAGSDGVMRLGTYNGAGAIGTSHFEWHVDTVWWLATIASVAYKVGGGPWNDSSDARIKTVTGNYASGLDAIRQLQPVTFTYKGNDTRAAAEGVVPYDNSPHRHVAQDSTQFIGLVAQDCEVAMPEIVTQRSAYIDGVAVTDLRDLDTGPLLFALINAVKELAGQVAELKAKRA